MSGLLITRQDIIDCDVCSGGLADFDEVFPSGETDTETLLAECAIKDSAEGNRRAVDTSYTLWAKVLIKNKYGISTGREIVSMNEKYQVFNPTTGLHTEYETLAAARTARQAVIDSWLETNIRKFSVAQESVLADGNTAWVLLSEEEIAGE